MKEGWEYKKFGEVCWYNKNNGLHKGTRYVGMEHIEQGTGRLLCTTSSDDVLSNTFAFNKGDVLYGRLRPYLKKVIVADFDGCCSTELFPIQSKDIIAPFLKYWFLTDEITNKINATCAGCRMPRGNMNDVLKFDISYPPLSEQQSIVDYLDSAFAKIDAMKANAEKALNEAKALFQASLIKMLEPKDGWEEKALKDFVTDMYRGSGVKREQVTDEGISCVRYGEIYTKYNFHFNECDSHTHEEYVSSPKYFEHGDILFAITGESVEEIGKSIAYTGNEKCIAGGDIVVMKHIYEPRFISYALATPSAVKQKGHGKTKLKVVHTNIPSLKEIIIPIAPKNEQIRIADTLDSLKSKVDRLQKNFDKISQECDALKQAILRQVFE